MTWLRRIVEMVLPGRDSRTEREEKVAQLANYEADLYETLERVDRMVPPKHRRLRNAALEAERRLR